MRDIVIIGSGPAGLSAAVYATRALLDVLVVEREPMSGGQMIYTEQVDNYLGLPGISGFDMAVKFKEHAQKTGAEFFSGEAEKIEEENGIFRILLKNHAAVETKAIIAAPGAKHKTLGVPGESKLKGAGVSYCATCDGAFFKGKETVVVGGGDVALEDALYLSNLCKKVYLIHRREELRGAVILQKKIREAENIEFLPCCEVKEILGGDRVEGVTVCDNRTGEMKNLVVSGVFIAVGMLPDSRILKDVADLDASGYVIAGEDCRTSKKGIFAAGDVRTKPLRQIANAVADGAAAVYSAEQYFFGLQKTG